MKPIVSVCLIIAFLSGGCAATSDTFLEDALVKYKRAFVSAQERIVLEELAKYSIWGETVALLNISGVTLEPQTKLTRGSKITTSGEFSYSTAPGGKLGLSREVTVSNEQAGKITVQLKASPKGSIVFPAFERAKQAKIIEIIWITEEQLKQQNGIPCGQRHKFYQCVPISGYFNDQGAQAYGYIPNVDNKIIAFRKLLRELSTDDQGPFFTIN